MYGQSAASLQSLCLDSQFSPEKVESINWSRSSKFLELHPGSRFRPWTQNTKNTGSLKLDLCLGRKFSDTGHLVKLLTSSLAYCNMTRKHDQHHWVRYWTHILMSLENRIVDFPTEDRCQICSTSLKMSIIWSHRQFNNASPSGTQAHNMERRHEQVLAKVHFRITRMMYNVKEKNNDHKAALYLVLTTDHPPIQHLIFWHRAAS